MNKEKLVELLVAMIGDDAPLEKNSGSNKLPVSIGDKIFIRTVSYHQVGEVSLIFWPFVRLINASWIADSGRLSETLANGSEFILESKAAQRVLGKHAIG